MLRIWTGYSANISNNIALFHARIGPLSCPRHILPNMQSSTQPRMSIKVVIAFEMSIYRTLLSRMGRVGHARAACSIELVWELSSVANSVENHEDRLRLEIQRPWIHVVRTRGRRMGLDFAASKDLKAPFS